MKRIKTLLILVLVVALVVLVSGCGMLGSRSAGVDTGSSSIDELPQWLTLAHRAEAAEEPEIEEDEEAAKEEAAEAPTQTATTQPATQQPATQQPATQQPATQQPAQTGKPLWQQPGTMEYLAKIQLDQKHNEYLREKNGNGDKEIMAKILGEMYIIAKGIGLDLTKEYGMTVTSAEQNSGWFHNWNESPSGFGN